MPNALRLMHLFKVVLLILSNVQCQPSPDALREAKLSARMLLQVHDELIFEVPDNELDATKDVVKEVMEGAATLSVPLEVDIGTGTNWDEAH